MSLFDYISDDCLYEIINRMHIHEIYNMYQMGISNINSIIESESYYVNRAMHRFGITRDEYEKKYEYYLKTKDVIKLSDPDNHKYPRSMVIYLLTININHTETPNKNKYVNKFNHQYIETGYEHILLYPNHLRDKVEGGVLYFKTPDTILSIVDLALLSISTGLISVYEYYYKNVVWTNSYIQIDSVLHNVSLYKNADAKYLIDILRITYNEDDVICPFLQGL